MHLNIHFNQWNNACQFKILFEINLSDVIHECRVIKKKTAKKNHVWDFLTMYHCGSVVILKFLTMSEGKEMYFQNEYWQSHCRPQIGLFSNWFHGGIKIHWVIPLHCVGMCSVLMDTVCVYINGRILFPRMTMTLVDWLGAKLLCV